MSNQRDIKLDIIRIVACLMVITMHAPIPNENAIGIFNVALSYYTAPCIGLFFMVSGALLLPIKGNGIDFLKRRFTKIAGPTVFWSIFYIACKYFFEGTSEGIAKSMLSIPFSPQGHGVMWFMYTLAGLYLIAPIISAWLERTSKKEIEIYLSIWLLTTCYPLLKLFLTTQTGETSILYYLSGFAGYFLLGYYLKKYPKAISHTVLLPAIIIAICAPIVCKILHFEVNMYDMFWYLSIFVVVMAIEWFYLINNKIQVHKGGGYYCPYLQSFIRNILGAYFRYAIYFVEIGYYTKHKFLYNTDNHCNYCNIYRFINLMLCNCKIAIRPIYNWI